MCDQDRACGKSTSRPDDSCCLYDHPKHSHEHCYCGKRMTSRRCACCKKRFKPNCSAAIFCCYDCFFKSGLAPYWDCFCAAHGNDIEKLKKFIAKKLYRRSEKGVASRKKEYENRNDKRREERKRERESPPSMENKEMTLAVLPPSQSKTKRCRRPGCPHRIILPPQVQVKHFCSGECKNSFRNIRNILKTAYKRTQCPCVLLALAFLLSL